MKARRRDRTARRSALTVVSVAVLVLMGNLAYGVAEPPVDVRKELRQRIALDRGQRQIFAPARPKQPPPVAEVARDDLFRALQRGQVTTAQYALQRAASVFRLQRVRARFGSVAEVPSRYVTVILRDLAARLAELSPGERERAQRILARPTDGAADPHGQGYAVPEHSPPLCNLNFCIHWVDSTIDAPPLADVTPANGVPDWVDVVQGVIQQVWDFEVVKYGYRPPKSDATSPNNGGNGLLDVYLAQLGDVGVYGYCTTDDPNTLPAAAYPFYDISAYCVLDNDFSPLEFPPPANGLMGLQVTAAHEFFHAVQAAYDFLEDLWMMEGTATWMEDEVFDEANDNLQYLPASALTQSTVPLDFGAFDFEYGSWAFWRFLREYFGDSADPAAGPAFIRRVWEWSDGAAGGPDLYSSEAIEKAARERNSRYRFAFADFGAVNFVPWTFYEEGQTYPSPGAKRIKVSRSRPDTRMRKVVLHHLTTRYVMFVPGAGVTRKAKLAVTLDLPQWAQGPEATILLMFKSGAVRFFPIRLNNSGAGFRKVNFNRRRIAGVVLALTNASARFVCWQVATPYSCSGIPMDDGRRFRFSARLVQ